MRGDRIIRIAADADFKPSAEAEIIDAQSRFLMPGLWDNHQHLSSPQDGPLDLANGLPSARDMGNDPAPFPQPGAPSCITRERAVGTAEIPK